LSRTRPLRRPKSLNPRETFMGKRARSRAGRADILLKYRPGWHILSERVLADDICHAVLVTMEKSRTRQPTALSSRLLFRLDRWVGIRQRRCRGCRARVSFPQRRRHHSTMVGNAPAREPARDGPILR
jgi:hypothetical protein